MDSPGTQGEVGSKDSEFQCPECGDEMSRQGAHGHLRWKHDYSSLQARRALKDQAPETAALIGGGGVDSSTGEADIDEALSHVSGRFKETADFLAAKNMMEELKSDSGDAASTAEQMEAFASAMAKMNEAVGGGVEGRERDLEAVLREIRNRNRDRRASVSTGEGGVVEAALVNGVDDPDVLAGLASLDPERRKVELEEKRLDRRQQMVEDAIDAIASALEDAPGSVTEAAIEALLSPNDRRTAVEERAPSPADRAPEPPAGPEPVDSGRYGDATEADGGLSGRHSDMRTRYEELKREAEEMQREAEEAGLKESSDQNAEEPDASDDVSEASVSDDEPATKYSTNLEGGDPLPPEPGREPEEDEK